VTRAKVDNILLSRPLNEVRLHVLSTMLTLRQVCCDPRLIKTDLKTPMQGLPAKVEAMIEICDELVADNKRVVITSEWTEWLHLIRQDLLDAGYASEMLIGDMSGRERKAASDRFRSGQVQILLMQLVLGEGIELPEGDVLISAEPWWNEMREQQALARLRRDERNKSIKLIRLNVPSSVEVGVRRVAQYKLDDTAAVNEGHAIGVGSLNREDIEAFFDTPPVELD
jgi:SNF2 family DNA or RNA helicase